MKYFQEYSAKSSTRLSLIWNSFAVFRAKIVRGEIACSDSRVVTYNFGVRTQRYSLLIVSRDFSSKMTGNQTTCGRKTER
jgi:hypothetical protein